MMVNDLLAATFLLVYRRKVEVRQFEDFVHFTSLDGRTKSCTQSIYSQASLWILIN